MNALVELIKRIGIFMIAAQAVIHFTPGQKYEKYIKLIVGMLILLQFVAPLRSIIGRTEIDWNAQMEEMERMLETEGLADETAGSSSVEEAVMSSVENEIKSKLNNEVSGEEYVISSVRVYMKVSGGVVSEGADSSWKPSDWQREAGTRQYELEKVHVAVYRRNGSADDQTQTSEGNPIEKIQIEKIDIGGAADSSVPASEPVSESGSPHKDETEETAAQLRKRFCYVLGMDEEKMEVSVYGTNEKAD